MNRAELQTKLGVTDKQLADLLAEGLPRRGRGKGQVFEWPAVQAWLVSKGYAKPKAPAPEVAPRGKICHTYADLAAELKMTQAAPERVIQFWTKRPGFPGRAGTPGRRDAYLPVDEIRAWLANLGSDAGGDNGDDETRELQRRLLRLKLEREERQALVELGRLADCELVSQFNRQCVADARALLETIPEQVAELLPAACSSDDRSRVYLATQAAIDLVCEELARMMAGDAPDENAEP